MSESQNKIENEKVENGEVFESTVFSDPTLHRETADNVKKKSRVKVIVASITAVAVLAGGAFAVSYFIEPPEPEVIGSQAEGVTILELKEADVKSCTVTNKLGSYKLTNETTKSGEYDICKWYVEGIEKAHIDTTKTAKVIDAVLKLTSNREVTKLTAEECGFENPQSLVQIEKNNGEIITLTIGDGSFDSTGDYVRLSTADKFYVLSSEVRTAINVSVLSFAATDVTPTFPTKDVSSTYKSDEGVLAAFDKLVISGNKFPKNIVLEKNNDASTNTVAPYMVTSPIKHFAQNQDGIISMFATGLTPVGAYAFDVNAETLAQFGFNNPDMQFTMTVEDETVTYKFALQNDGNYAVVSDGMTLIAAVSPEDLAFKNFKTEDYYCDWITMVYLGDLKQLSVKTPEKAYQFDITENSADDKSIVVKYNGQLLDSDNFKNYYSSCIILSAADYEPQKVSGKADYTITYVFNDEKGGKQTIEFFKVSETKYQYRINGTDMGKVTSADLKNIINNTERVASGQQINNN